MTKLGVNIDHAATLRQVRYRGKENLGEPNVIEVALLCEQSGADGITAHLREDRRHIVDKDIHELKSRIRTRLNFEMANTEEMVSIAENVRPSYICLVPEKRQEITTEGGLDVKADIHSIRTTCDRLQSRGDIQVSLFIDPDISQVEAAAKSGAKLVEFHTGQYAEHYADPDRRHDELIRLQKATRLAAEMGLVVNAGHGLNYQNTSDLVKFIPDFFELNIGHSILCRALIVGIGQAVAEMKALLQPATP